MERTRSRRAGDGYSWLQAVYWVVAAGVYRPRRAHGPGELGETTIDLARVLTEFSPCRPGMKQLVRRLGLARRTVAYHLGMLRETGLLAYEVRGTRVSGGPPQASEFMWTIPPVFDSAMGIRTVGEGPGRRPVGCAEESREELGRLGRRVTRRRRRRRAGRGRSRTGTPRRCRSTAIPAAAGAAGARVAPARCTPMEAGRLGTSRPGRSSGPPEKKLPGDTALTASAAMSKPPRPARRRRSGRRLAGTARRYQLARQLIGSVDWLRRCDVPRIAWVIREVADAGWDAEEVRAWLSIGGEPQRIRRPSGLLATALRGATQLAPTPAARRACVDHWHASEETRRRHRIRSVRAERERHEGDWQLPENPRLRARLNQVRHQVEADAHHQLHAEPGTLGTSNGSDPSPHPQEDAAEQTRARQALMAAIAGQPR